MPREYRHIKQYEKEILEFKSEGVKLKTYEEARLLIGEYIRFYNNERIQTKTKLTPLEKRSQYVA